MTAVTPAKAPAAKAKKKGEATEKKKLLGGHKLKLIEPTPGDTRSVLADWVELIAFLSPRGITSKATLVGLLALAGDDAADDRDGLDEETGEAFDEAILEAKVDQFVSTVFDELADRKAALGQSYPFEVDGVHTRIIRSVEDGFSHLGQVVYLFCLLASAIRDKRLRPVKPVDEAETGIGNTFQICACLAAGGYTSGEVASFGFPRPDGTSFLPALKKTFARFGFGKIHEEAPEGYPTDLKDGGIDVMAWRDFPDGMPGKLFLLGQCASGGNWRGKSVTEYIGQLGAWFVGGQPPKHSLPAMFILFPFHHEISLPKKSSFKEAVKKSWYFEELRYGIIFDRLRVAHFAHACLSLPDQIKQKIDGITKFEDVREWVEEAALLAQEEGVAA